MSGESRIDVSIVTVVHVVSDHVPPAKTKACPAFLPFQEPWLFSRVTCSHQDLLIVCLRQLPPVQTGLAQTAAPSYDPHPADFGQPFRAVPLLGKVPPSCWHLTAEPP